MLRWAGERQCVIEIKGEEYTHNVNRLIKHYVWDEMHDRTDVKSAHPIHAPTIPIRPGELILFPTAYNRENKCFFGIGRVLEIRGKNNFSFQWYGSPLLPEAHKPFLPGWVDRRGYYALRKLHHSHPAWTNEDTATELDSQSVILRGPDILTESNHVHRKHRERIERMTGEKIRWE